MSTHRVAARGHAFPDHALSQSFLDIQLIARLAFWQPGSGEDFKRQVEDLISAFEPKRSHVAYGTFETRRLVLKMSVKWGRSEAQCPDEPVLQRGNDPGSTFMRGSFPALARY